MLGVLALDLASDTVDLETMLNGDASQFKPHISVLPRFLFEDSRVITLPAVAGTRVQLAGPYDNGAGLWWYECTMGKQGYEWLLALHVEVSKSLAKFVQPVEPRFWGDGYRPHLTIGVYRDALHLHPHTIIEVVVTTGSLYTITLDNPLTVIQRSTV